MTVSSIILFLLPSYFSILVNILYFFVLPTCIYVIGSRDRLVTRA